jgi:hypothetical protein
LLLCFRNTRFTKGCSWCFIKPCRSPTVNGVTGIKAPISLKLRCLKSFFWIRRVSLWPGIRLQHSRAPLAGEKKVTATDQNLLSLSYRCACGSLCRYSRYRFRALIQTRGITLLIPGTRRVPQSIRLWACAPASVPATNNAAAGAIVPALATIIKPPPTHAHPLATQRPNLPDLLADTRLYSPFFHSPI